MWEGLFLNENYYTTQRTLNVWGGPFWMKIIILHNELSTCGRGHFEWKLLNYITNSQRLGGAILNKYHITQRAQRLGGVFFEWKLFYYIASSQRLGEAFWKKNIIIHNELATFARGHFWMKIIIMHSELSTFGRGLFEWRFLYYTANFQRLGGALLNEKYYITQRTLNVWEGPFLNE